MKAENLGQTKPNIFVMDRDKKNTFQQQIFEMVVKTFLDKLHSTGQSLSWKFNSRSVHMTCSACTATEQPDLKLKQGILKGKISLYHWPPVWQVWNQQYDNWQFLYLFANQTNPTNQTGGQWYSDTSPFSIPWLKTRPEHHFGYPPIPFSHPKNCTSQVCSQ